MGIIWRKDPDRGKIVPGKPIRLTFWQKLRWRGGKRCPFCGARMVWHERRRWPVHLSRCHGGDIEYGIDVLEPNMIYDIPVDEQSKIATPAQVRASLGFPFLPGRLAAECPNGDLFVERFTVFAELVHQRSVWYAENPVKIKSD